MAVRFIVTGAESIDRTLENIQLNISDMSPVWDALADRFGDANLKQFRTEGASGSGKWAPLSPAYAKWKLGVVGSKPILQFSGDLLADLTQQPFGIDVRTPNLMVLGTALPYASYHQKGSGNLPERPPIAFTEQERREWVRVIQSYIITGRA